MENAVQILNPDIKIYIIILLFEWETSGTFFGTIFGNFPWEKQIARAIACQYTWHEGQLESYKYKIIYQSLWIQFPFFTTNLICPLARFCHN